MDELNCTEEIDEQQAAQARVNEQQNAMQNLTPGLSGMDTQGLMEPHGPRDAEMEKDTGSKKDYSIGPYANIDLSTARPLMAPGPRSVKHTPAVAASLSVTPQ